jgi:hypothetical protein
VKEMRLANCSVERIGQASTPKKKKNRFSQGSKTSSLLSRSRVALLAVLVVKALKNLS